MRLFSRTTQHPDKTVIEDWRGRSRELEDVSGLHWQVLMAALQTERRHGDDMDEMFAGLGLAVGEIAARWADSVGGVRLSGCRHGRQVEIRIGLRERNRGMAAAMVTWIRAATPDPHLSGDGRGAIHPQVAKDAELWSGVEVRGGPEGLVAFRKLTSRVHSQGYLYDLWLLERLAEANAGTALPFRDLTDVRVPYGMG
jgi:hypothetical protein